MISAIQNCSKFENRTWFGKTVLSSGPPYRFNPIARILFLTSAMQNERTLIRALLDMHLINMIVKIHLPSLPPRSFSSYQALSQI